MTINTYNEKLTTRAVTCIRREVFASPKTLTNNGCLKTQILDHQHLLTSLKLNFMPIVSTTRWLLDSPVPTLAPVNQASHEQAILVKGWRLSSPSWKAQFEIPWVCKQCHKWGLPHLTSTGAAWSESGFVNTPQSSAQSMCVKHIADTSQPHLGFRLIPRHLVRCTKSFQIFKKKKNKLWSAWSWEFFERKISHYRFNNPIGFSATGPGHSVTLWWWTPVSSARALG